jgi:medium-chain acyl-[acyl-carrier-protein] hydrolase
VVNGNSLVRPLTDRPNAAVRLFCFPYACGGVSVFRDWGAQLPSAVDVWSIQLPGREDRISQPLIDRMDDLLAALVPAIVPRLDRPFAFYGHSMGALVCWELARALQALELGPPGHLFVSACQPPHARQVPADRLSELPDDELVERLSTWHTMPTQVLRDAELMQLLLPAIRADITIWESYTYRSATPLTCTVTAFGGDGDPGAGADLLARWGELTLGAFDVRTFSGDHFFLHSACSALLAEIAKKLTLVPWS